MESSPSPVNVMHSIHCKDAKYQFWSQLEIFVGHNGYVKCQNVKDA